MLRVPGVPEFIFSKVNSLCLTKSELTMPWLGQSSGLLICSKEPILSEQHHVFQQRRRVTSKGWLEVEAERLGNVDGAMGKGEVNGVRRSGKEKE